jgi:UDP-glucuronate 4-epimerase
MADDRVVITGAAGFIGSHVAEALLRRGAAVVGLDNWDPFYDRSIKERNVAAVRETAAATGGTFELVTGDFCDEGLAKEVCAGAHAVVHLGAKAGVRPSIADPIGYARANVLGTAAVLAAAQNAGCSRVVAASSSSVYGNQFKTPFAESDVAVEPISPYAATKRSCELLGYAHHHLTGQPVAMLRFFTVFGPRQRPDLAISLFMRRIARGESIRLFGDGGSSRDYTYVADIVEGVLAALDRIEDYGFRVWNLGSDRPTALDDLVSCIAGVVGREAVIERAAMQPGDVERTWADLTRARAELNYNPTTQLRDGVERQWSWMREAEALA